MAFSEFKLICGNCGEEAVINVYETQGIINGTSINLDFNIDEDNLDYSVLKVDCYKCGNSVEFKR